MNLNNKSIGIEIQNSGHINKYESFSIKQIKSLLLLTKSLKSGSVLSILVDDFEPNSQYHESMWQATDRKIQKSLELKKISALEISALLTSLAILIFAPLNIEFLILK